MGKRMASAIIMLAVMAGGSLGSAEASTDEEMFRRAEAFVREAEASLKPDTDPLTKQKLAEAKAVLRSAEMGNPPARPLDGMPVGERSWNSAGVRAVWAESVARQVIFLTTGKVRWSL